MNKKTSTSKRRGTKSAVLVACFLTLNSPMLVRANDVSRAPIDPGLQDIFKRINQKYKDLEVQQAQVDVPIEEPTTSTPAQPSDTIRQSVDEWPPAPLNESRFSAGEELILSVAVNSLALAEVFALKTHRNFQLGLGDFLQIIEFPVYVDLASVSAEGWFFNEGNRFSLTQLPDDRLEVAVNGETFYVEPDDYTLADDDLYIEIDDIARWFDFTYVFTEQSLDLNVQSKTKFPVEARLARLNKRSPISTGSSKSTLPLQESAYQAVSPPLLDVQVSGRKTDLSESGSYSILGRHDLAYFNAELFMAGNDQDALNTAWFNLSRRSANADLLGPLKATEFAFGDVVPVNTGFGQTRGFARGVSLANTPINQLADNRRVNLTGEIQVGWDVELYRNGILINAEYGIADGRYEFNDTELEFGSNDFELIFYGPQGQIESRTESYLVDSNTVSSREGQYRFSVVEVHESVFNLDSITEDPTQQGTLASAVFDYGLTDWLSLTSGATLFEPKLGDMEERYSLRTNAVLGKFGLASAGVQWDTDERKLQDYSYRTRLFETSYSIDHRRSDYVDFLSGDDRAIETSSIGMTGKLFSRSRVPLSYQNTWQRNEQSNGVSSEFFQNAIGIQSRFGAFNNSLVWYKDGISDEALVEDLFPDPNVDPFLPDDNSVNADYRVTGGFQYRKSFGRFHTRFFTDYAVKPESEFISYGGAFNYNWTNDLNTDLRYSYFIPLDQYQVNLGMNWRKEAFQLSTNAGYSDAGTWSAGLTLRFSLGYEPMQQRMFTSGRPIAQSGAAAVRTFEDLNMNGVYDEGEPLIENATVKAVQGYRQATTNASGVAVLTALYDNVTTDIVVDESTLDGPFMIRATPGVAITARKGFLAQVDLPVVKAGELEGIIYFIDEAGEEKPAPYIMLNLINDNDEVVASTRSEFDGLYLFTDVVPGNYRLKIDHSYIDRRGLKEVRDKQVQFSSAGDVITGVDFMLFPLDAAAGYVASAGEFDTPSMLKLYYHILRNRLGDRFVQKPFYIRPTENNGYVLGLAYYAGEIDSDAKIQAEEACARIALTKLSCNVEYHNFKY